MITIDRENPLPDLVATYRRATKTATWADKWALRNTDDRFAEIAQRNDELADITRHQFQAQLERLCDCPIEDIRRILL